LQLDKAIYEVLRLNAIAEYGLIFFDRYLRGDPSADQGLNGSHPTLDAYEEKV
jgi:hypothetical protein